MKNKLPIIILIGLLSFTQSAFSAAPAAQCEFYAEKAPEPACADLLHKIEFVIANLASDTYELIDLQRRYQFHAHLEFNKSQRKIIDDLNTFVYKNDNYNALTRIFKFNKQEGIDAALRFFEKIAEILKITLPSRAGLILEEQKLDWLKAAAKQIKKQYKTFKPTLKEKSTGTSIKRAIIFNPVTRHIPLTQLAEILSSKYAQVAEAALTASIADRYGTNKDYLKKARADAYSAALATEQKLAGGGYSAGAYTKADAAADAVAPKEDKGFFKTLKDEIASQKNLRTTGAVLTVQILNQMLSDYLQSLAADKKKYEEQEKFEKMPEEQKEIKSQLHRMISHAGTGEGFSTIRGIQDDKTIKELTFFADWLKKPISYSGSKLALMLYGEPGNGKGIITKALSDESKTPMITISADDVAQRQIGTKLWAAKQIAKDNDQKSVIVFFDEIDLIVPPKNPAALQSFLTFLDGTQNENPHVRVLYIFATNHIEKLDPRMLRPGRFKSKVYVGPPSQDQRAKLIEMNLISVFKAAPADLVEKLAVATDGLSRVAIAEAIENTYNHAALTEETPSLESFLEEIEKLKEVTYHSSKQVA
jgi:SpoVK/Ycf46/Vps4 family AAA+-type ATPase